jgi:hypothetical protein
MSDLASYQTTELFKAHLKKYNLTGFGGKEITTSINKDGIMEKKLGMCIKDWSKIITRDNYETFIPLKYKDKKTGTNHPSSFYIKTGKDVGVCGIDFDTPEAYNAFIKSNPECKEHFTQKTKKGYHILFHYDDRLNHSCSNSEHENPECKIDFRSNGGCLISYPTKYYHHETNAEYSYDIYRDGELGVITDKIVKYFDDRKIIYYQLKKDTKSRMTKKKKEIKEKIQKNIEKVEEKMDEIHSQSGKIFKQMCSAFSRERVSNYTPWFEMGCSIKNHFVNKGKEKEGIDCFQYFSSLKDENGELFYKKYNADAILYNWSKMEVFKTKKTDKNKSWEKIKKWAKRDNAEIFSAIFDISELNLTSSYSDLKTAFEETNFKVRNPVGFCEIVEIDGQEEMIIRNGSDLNTLYENLFWTQFTYQPSADGEGEGTWDEEEKLFVKDWRKDPDCLTYERVDFRPYCLEDTTPDNIYNLFRGFNALKYYTDWKDDKKRKREATDTEEGIGILLQHLKDLSGDPDFYEYFLDCLAFKVQFPHRKNNIAIILKSLQGAGKDSFCDWFGNEILGSKYYLNIQGLTQLENFNALLSCKLFVVINEFEIKESIANKEKLKALITSVENVINEKHEKQRKEKDYSNYFFLTNNEISFSIESGDRRMTATEANNAICNDAVYFNKMYKYIYGRNKNGDYNGKDFIAPFFQFLLNRDVENKDWINTRVKTEYSKTLQDYSISPLVRFFEYLNNKHYKHGATYNGKVDAIESGMSVFSGSAFYNLFKDFRTEWGYKSADWSSTLFGTKLKHHTVITEADANIAYKFISKRKANVMCYVLDNDKMIAFLESEGIISTKGECLIPKPKPNINADDLDDDDNY